MTAGFRLGSGKLAIKNADDLTVFDTDDGLFHVIDTFSGTIPIATANVGNGSNFNLTTDVTIGTCHADCTDVIGSIKFTLNNYDAGFAYDRWHTMMGGSALWLIDGQGPSGSIANINLTVMVWYSFVIESATVKLRRRLYCSQNVKPNYAILSHSITYKLKAGLFT